MDHIKTKTIQCQDADGHFSVQLVKLPNGSIQMLGEDEELAERFRNYLNSK